MGMTHQDKQRESSSSELLEAPLSIRNYRCHVCRGELTYRFRACDTSNSTASFSIAVCKDCELGHTVPRPSDLEAYYSPGYHGGRHGFTSRYCTWRRMRFVHSAVGPGSGRRLLDVGCGEGSFLLAARKQGWIVAGTEISEERARTAGIEVRKSLEDVSELGPFHCVTSWHSLEHFEDPRSTLSRIRDLLVPGGGVVVAVPDAQGFQAKIFRGNWFHLDVPRHLYHFGWKSLKQLLESEGYVIRRSWHQELEYDVMGWSQSFLSTVLPNPNVFFDQLRHKGRGASVGEAAANLTMGLFCSALALPVTWFATLVKRGSTLVVAASRS